MLGTWCSNSALPTPGVHSSIPSDQQFLPTGLPNPPLSHISLFGIMPSFVALHVIVVEALGWKRATTVFSINARYLLISREIIANRVNSDNQSTADFPSFSGCCQLGPRCCQKQKQKAEAPRKDHLSFVPQLPVEATPQKPSALEVLVTGSPLRAVLSWSDSGHLRIPHAHRHFPILCPFPPSLTPVPSSTYLELMKVRTDHGDSDKELPFFCESCLLQRERARRQQCQP